MPDMRDDEVVRVEGGWVRKAELRVENGGGSWTTLCTVSLSMSDAVEIDATSDWPSIAGLDPLVPTQSFMLATKFIREAIGNMSMGRMPYHMLLTFTLTKRGYEISQPQWIIESDDFEACPIRTWFKANEEGVPIDELCAVLNLKPGESYEGGGGAGAEWKVTRRAA